MHRASAIAVGIVVLAVLSLGCSRAKKNAEHHEHDGHAHDHDHDHATDSSTTATDAVKADGAAGTADEVIATATPPTGEGHAPEGVVPGSWEDWCAEHGVPESQCTRCNAALIPAFKAVGDWCDIHGLPVTQDLVCHPEMKIERPPKPTGT